MGHNQKNANRAEAIARNAGRAETNRKAIAKLRDEYRKNKTKRDRELLELERRVLGELQAVEIGVHVLAADLDLHSRPWYRKAIDWTRTVLRLDPDEPEALPELVDIDFEDIGQEADAISDPDDEETDPAIVLPELDDQADAAEDVPE